MIDPYEALGLARHATEAEVRAAYRRRVKKAHPDTGGSEQEFEHLTLAYDLLKDPVRRKIYDETGYDPQLADVQDLEGLLVLDKFVNELILDERDPGSFDPVALMRRRLTDEIVNTRFHILELERHRARIRNHLDRISERPSADVLGSMLRARSDTLAEAISKAEKQIKAVEQAYTMLEGYRYAVEVVEVRAAE
ncbi:J domain-containing protein [Oryzifoliimicrobium ureilyticus]|uniref:J domain-containing protein n=1 Tax=Oryzifoliimicrobium ureilyticus TaxID=3113724 RepID=UPI0030761C0D